MAFGGPLTLRHMPRHTVDFDEEPYAHWAPVKVTWQGRPYTLKKICHTVSDVVPPSVNLVIPFPSEMGRVGLSAAQRTRVERLYGLLKRYMIVEDEDGNQFRATAPARDTEKFLRDVNKALGTDVSAEKWPTFVKAAVRIHERNIAAKKTAVPARPASGRSTQGGRGTKRQRTGRLLGAGAGDGRDDGHEAIGKGKGRGKARNADRRGVGRDDQEPHEADEVAESTGAASGGGKAGSVGGGAGSGGGWAGGGGGMVGSAGG
ncbi:unnamed protein product, partial [Pylaiella littoralis]